MCSLMGEEVFDIRIDRLPGDGYDPTPLRCGIDQLSGPNSKPNAKDDAKIQTFGHGSAFVF